MTDFRHLHLNRLRSLMVALQLDGLLVPRTDAHQSEITPEHDACLAWLCGFTGSAGMALALLFVDGRYQVQARNEVDLTDWQIHHLHDAPPEVYLATHGAPRQRIGVDALRVSLAQFRRIEEACRTTGARLVALNEDPFAASGSIVPLRHVDLSARYRGRLPPRTVAESVAASVRDLPAIFWSKRCRTILPGCSMCAAPTWR